MTNADDKNNQNKEKPAEVRAKTVTPNKSRPLSRIKKPDKLKHNPPALTRKPKPRNVQPRAKTIEITRMVIREIRATGCTLNTALEIFNQACRQFYDVIETEPDLKTQYENCRKEVIPMVLGIVGDKMLDIMQSPETLNNSDRIAAAKVLLSQHAPQSQDINLNLNLNRQLSPADLQAELDEIERMLATEARPVAIETIVNTETATAGDGIDG